VPSQVLFEGTGGKLHKTGYAPLRDATGRVVAVVGADGIAPSFETLRGFRRTLATVAIAGALLGALVAALAALTVTRPLVRITLAARRIARGDLETPLWRRKRRDEIGTLRDTLEEMRRALHARDEERETLLAGIAHEVRNPLGALDLFAGLLAEELAARPGVPPLPPTGGEGQGEGAAPYASARQVCWRAVRRQPPDEPPKGCPPPGDPRGAARPPHRGALECPPISRQGLT
jgi:signal transduction histidine kinase